MFSVYNSDIWNDKNNISKVLIYFVTLNHDQPVNMKIFSYILSQLQADAGQIVFDDTDTKHCRK